MFGLAYVGMAYLGWTLGRLILEGVQIPLVGWHVVTLPLGITPVINRVSVRPFVSGHTVRHVLITYDKPIEQMFLDWLRVRDEKH